MNPTDDLIRAVVVAHCTVTFTVDTTFEMDFCARCLSVFRNEPVFTHEGTDWPVCPQCGHEHEDAWAWKEYSDQECANCGKEFRCVRSTIITYRTQPLGTD